MALYETDYVLYDIANDHVVQHSNGKVVIYGNKEEAMNDCYGNEAVVSCLELPLHWQRVILNQINDDIFRDTISLLKIKMSQSHWGNY